MRPRGGQHNLPVALIGHPRLKITKQVAGPFHADQIGYRKAGGRELTPQLTWPVRNAAEPIWLKRRQQTTALDVVDHLLGGRKAAVDPLPQHAIEPSGPAGDHRTEDRAARPQDPAGLAQRMDPVGPTGQVIQRAEQQHGIHGLVTQVKAACVADRCFHSDASRRGSRSHLVDVHRNDVTVQDPIAKSGQPDGVSSWPAAYICDNCRRRRQVPLHDLLGPLELQPA